MRATIRTTSLSLSILLLAGIAIACPDEDAFRLSLKKGLFDYLANPQEAHLSLNELKDFISSYMTGSFEGADCSTLIGPMSGVDFETMIDKTLPISEGIIPRCPDLTPYGECSTEKPKFCYSGKPKLMCAGVDSIPGNDDDCGCPDPVEVCGSDGLCSMGTIVCVSSADCGPEGLAGEPFCIGSIVHQQMITWQCENPGTLASACVVSSTDVPVEDCAPRACAYGICI